MALARLIAEQPALELRGVQGYAGHVQAIPDYAERRRRSHEALAVLARARDALLEAGLPAPSSAAAAPARTTSTTRRAC